MYELLNVLYVQKQGAVLHLDHDTVRIAIDGETKLRVPLLRLQGIVVFGQVTVTPFLLHRCADDGRELVWMTNFGRYKAQLSGPVTGNVLLRRAQHLALSNAARTLNLARQIVAAKLQNSRIQLLRSARDAPSAAARATLSQAAAELAGSLERLPQAGDLDQVRGTEGDAARVYFGAFPAMVRGRQGVFAFRGRTRRPPQDPVNAILSFLYSLTTSECAAALAGVGLDPQVGYLHTLRPGRPALALDVVEELRAALADRLALTLINRGQVQEKHFETTPGDGVYLTEEGRGVVLKAYQERKEVEIEHRVLKQKLPIGLVPHVQARLLARYLRGDLEHYIPFVYR
jgi:CRISPR-associated protein Cas1